MDNFHIDITSEGDLVKPLMLAFRGYKAVAYIVDIKRGLVFLWHLNENPIGLVPLPFKLDAVGAADFAKRWLVEQDYGEQPDHDGDNGEGWRVYTQSWGRIDGLTYSIVAIQPVWAMYGK